MTCLHSGRPGTRPPIIALSGAACLALGACAGVAPRPMTLASAQEAPELGPIETPAPVARSPAPRRAPRSTSKLGAPYKAHGVWYHPSEQPNYDEVGLASWYGEAFNGKPTATGELFNMDGRSAAHATLPLPSIVEVTNLENGRSIRVRLNDRGPFHPGRIIDLSKGAAKELGFYMQGTAKVRVRYVGPVLGADTHLLYASTPMRSLEAPPKPSRRATAPEPTEAEQGFRPILARADGAQPDPGTRQYATAYDADVQALAQRLSGRGSADAAVAANRPQRTKSYGVQIGAFADRGAAERQASRLSETSPAAIRPKDVEGRRLYRVVVGAFATPEEASRVRDSVVALGYPAAEVTGAF